MTDWIIWLMETLGSPGAAVAIALESIFPPIPSELVLPLAGFTASQGGLDLVAAITWTTVGSVVGALALYALGRKLGPARLRKIAAKVPLLDPEDIDKTDAWFERHGRKAVFFGRMVPLFRSLISIPAGVRSMPLLTFVLLTAGGSAIWNATLILAGYFLGEQWDVAQRYTGIVQKIIGVAVLVALIWFVIKRVRRRRRPSPAS